MADKALAASALFKNFERPGKRAMESVFPVCIDGERMLGQGEMVSKRRLMAQTGAVAAECAAVQPCRGSALFRGESAEARECWC